MKLKIKRDLLLENLIKVSKAISTKNLIPILSGIKFELSKNGLTLTASNNDITIQTFIEVKEHNIEIEKEGTIIIQGKEILDIVRIIPEEEINIEILDDLKVLIYTNDLKIKYDLNAIDKNEYPNISLELSKAPVIIDSSTLLDIVKQTAFATSNDEARPELTGLNFKINGNLLEINATDSYRLARKQVSLEEICEENFNIIIPSRNIVEFSRIIVGNDNKVELHIFSNKIILKENDLLFQSRLINGNYPNTSNLLPEDSMLKIVTKLNGLYNVIEQASILSSDKEKNTVSLSTKKDSLTVKSVSNEKGKAEAEMSINKNNEEEISISFSAKFMMEALNGLNSGEVELSFVGEVKPIIVKNVGDDSLIQLVLPIRTY